MPIRRKRTKIARPGNRDCCPVAGSRSLRFESCESRTLLSGTPLALEFHGGQFSLDKMAVVSSFGNNEGGWISDHLTLPTRNYESTDSGVVFNGTTLHQSTDATIDPGDSDAFSPGETITASGPIVLQSPLSEADGVAGRVMRFRPIAGPADDVEGGAIAIPTTAEQAENSGLPDALATSPDLPPLTAMPRSSEVSSALLPDRAPLEGIQTRVVPLDVASLSGHELARSRWSALENASKQTRLADETSTTKAAAPAASAKAVAEDSDAATPDGDDARGGSDEATVAEEENTTASSPRAGAADDLISDMPSRSSDSEVAARDAALALWSRSPLPVDIDRAAAASEPVESSPGFARFYRPFIASAFLVLASRPALRGLRPAESRKSDRLVPRDR